MSHYLNKEMDVYCLIVNSALLNKYKFGGKTGRKKQKKKINISRKKCIKGSKSENMLIPHIKRFGRSKKQSVSSRDLIEISNTFVTKHYLCQTLCNVLLGQKNHAFLAPLGQPSSTD